MRGAQVIWCDACGKYVRVWMDFEWVCPDCGKDVNELKCTRCGNVWKPRRKTSLPTICPSCSSPYALRERTQKNPPQPSEPKTAKTKKTKKTDGKSVSRSISKTVDKTEDKSAELQKEELEWL